jgi:hypothetical protein
VFTDDSLDEGGAQLCPCGIATATPQHFTVASHTDIHMPAQKFPAEPKPDGCAPHPAHIHQIGAGEPLRDVQRWFLAYSSPSRSPNPHHLAVLARPGFVRAAPTHPGTSRDRLPPATTDLLRQDGGEGLSPPLNSSAPHGARGSRLIWRGWLSRGHAEVASAWRRLEKGDAWGSAGPGQRVVVDAWSRLICAGWVPQDRVFGGNGTAGLSSGVTVPPRHEYRCGTWLLIASGRVVPHAAGPGPLTPTVSSGWP